MANRAYIYSLSNRPASYADRPETISGLSEWGYGIPLSYRVLMSGNPQLCASLISDGFDGEPSDQKTKLYAISAEFELGFARLKRLLAAIRVSGATAPGLLDAIEETFVFLESHRDRFLLMETIELAIMTCEDPTEMRQFVEREIAECKKVGAAIDALSTNDAALRTQLTQAAQRRASSPLDALHGLRLDDQFDVDEDGTGNPLGLFWSDVLYFAIWNRAEFESKADRRRRG